VKETVFLVGKGVTYDTGGIARAILLAARGNTTATGGLDIKAGGIMAGMHRDKCGAASVAGVMAALAITKASPIFNCVRPPPPLHLTQWLPSPLA